MVRTIKEKEEKPLHTLAYTLIISFILLVLHLHAFYFNRKPIYKFWFVCILHGIINSSDLIKRQTPQLLFIFHIKYLSTLSNPHSSFTTGMLAGTSTWNVEWEPSLQAPHVESCCRASLIAALIAQWTEAARSNGGSPEAAQMNQQLNLHQPTHLPPTSLTLDRLWKALHCNCSLITTSTWTWTLIQIHFTGILISAVTENCSIFSLTFFS